MYGDQISCKIKTMSDEFLLQNKDEGSEYLKKLKRKEYIIDRIPMNTCK